MRRSRKPLCVVRRTGGSNPPLSARQPQNFLHLPLVQVGVSRCVVALVAAVFLPGCGTVAGDCSGGYLNGNSCVITERPVHWTAARAEAAAARFSLAPMLKARLRDVTCSLIPHKQLAVCSALAFKAGQKPRRAQVLFHLLDHGSVYPWCPGARYRYPFFPACHHS